MTEEIYGLPYIPNGAWLEERYVRCGKNCRCRLGEGILCGHPLEAA